MNKVFHILNSYMLSKLTDSEYEAGQAALDEYAAMRKKIAQYEDFLHAINYAVTAGNSARIKQLVDNAFRWGYAHRCGNGEYTDEEQQRIIDKAAANLERED